MTDARKPIIEIRNVTHKFDVSAPWLQRVLTRSPRKILRAVDDVSLTIYQGETVSLVGESGCGKSTLARILAGLYTPTAGSMELFGISAENLTEEDRQNLRRDVNMIFQDPYASLNPRWRVEDIVAEPLKVAGTYSKEEIARRVREAMELVRLPMDALDKYPHQFSGGQRQRISIARALTSRPRFLICDEPTSALDVSVQAQVLNLMKDLQEKTAITYLFISHNLAVVHHVSDRVGVMYLGRIVEFASKDDLFNNPQHPYTRMLLDAIPHLHEAGRARTPVAGEVPSPLNPPSGCTFHPRCPHACEKCRTQVPPLKEIRIDGRLRSVACHLVQ